MPRQPYQPKSSKIEKKLAEKLAKGLSPLLDQEDLPQAHIVTLGPPSTEEEKQVFFVELMKLKMKRYTNKECGETLGVSERTIVNYLGDPLYKDTIVAFEAESKQTAHLLVSDLAYTALETMRDLMDPDQTNSEYVRYSAARTVGEWLGLNVPREEARSNAQQEVVDFLTKLDMEQTHIQVNNIQVNMAPGKTPEEAGSEKNVVDATLIEGPAQLPLPQEEKEPSNDFPLVQPGGKLPEGW
jgi:hypothetical protein